MRTKIDWIAEVGLLRKTMARNRKMLVQIAPLHGLSAAHVNKFINGKREDPRLNEIAMMEILLDILEQQMPRGLK
jgi:hypothetical protein